MSPEFGAILFAGIVYTVMGVAELCNKIPGSEPRTMRSRVLRALAWPLFAGTEVG